MRAFTCGPGGPINSNGLLVVVVVVVLFVVVVVGGVVTDVKRLGTRVSRFGRQMTLLWL